ncbi:hypothetical protein PHLCEN_2v4003 [Hermanssonia centrifuga]|uniref:Uncharacterized protein n=1 Tax=Hermanssonia centrifuga TaxID=98765 RepID=A0A2R6Q7D8_9APHY|nr:hypothetical protein PHLCEN_2v4003 [Hermanssonia centrifuga]
MAGRPTAGTFQGDPWRSLGSVWSGGKQVGSEGGESTLWDGHIDPKRGWIIAACWIAASGAEEMADGLTVASSTEGDEVEMGGLLRRD